MEQLPPLEQVPSFMGRVAVSPSPEISTSNSGTCGYAIFHGIKALIYLRILRQILEYLVSILRRVLLTPRRVRVGNVMTEVGRNELTPSQSMCMSYNSGSQPVGQGPFGIE